MERFGNHRVPKRTSRYPTRHILISREVRTLFNSRRLTLIRTARSKKVNRSQTCNCKVETSVRVKVTLDNRRWSIDDVSDEISLSNRGSLLPRVLTCTGNESRIGVG